MATTINLKNQMSLTAYTASVESSAEVCESKKGNLYIMIGEEVAYLSKGLKENNHIDDVPVEHLYTAIAVATDEETGVTEEFRMVYEQQPRKVRRKLI